MPPRTGRLAAVPDSDTIAGPLLQPDDRNGPSESGRRGRTEDTLLRWLSDPLACA